LFGGHASEGRGGGGEKKKEKRRWVRLNTLPSGKEEEKDRHQGNKKKGKSFSFRKKSSRSFPGFGNKRTRGKKEKGAAPCWGRKKKRKRERNLPYREMRKTFAY